MADPKATLLSDRALLKSALKEGIKEWLDEQILEFGRWTLRGLLAAAFAGAIYLALRAQGWHK